MSDQASREGLQDVEGVASYLIPDIDRIPPFLMSVVSDGDRWMFVSSTGALTAGRVDAAGALFAYETDDRLHAAAGAVGPVTRMRVRSGQADARWDPFSTTVDPAVARSLAKSAAGDTVVFEEHHRSLDLTFRYQWATTGSDGFVRTATLRNEGADPVTIDIVDGLLDVLPHGLEPIVHQRFRNLTNAYKRSEIVDDASRLAVFSLESPVSDRAEPEEVLRANVVWAHGLPDASISLDARTIDMLDSGAPEVDGVLVTGRPGAYLLRDRLRLDPAASVTWRIVGDVGLDQVAVVALLDRLRTAADLDADLEAGILAAHESLVATVARADALQATGEPVACAHHLANVTYNVMRGGVPLDGYTVDADDFRDFVAERSRPMAARHRTWLLELPVKLLRNELLDRIATTGDAHLRRLGLEYLPFSFSRRHGDPSRPWNAFTINTHDEHGRLVVHYEGNWRDLFQNWEALCASYPEYLPGIIALFMNASTADGHNPYRITRRGIDWEAPDPEDPWANIGYWGDHQLIYLLRLLEAADRHLPGALDDLLAHRCFSYADVPYRIAPYEQLVRDPKATITFDHGANRRIVARAETEGGDGKLLHDAGGEIVLATMVEKLLVAALAKIANFVPGGGIWMNTQRPEWNDANNALVGHGLSMVTLIHLRMYLAQVRSLVTRPGANTTLSVDVATWLEEAREILLAMEPLAAARDDEHRRALLDRLGRSGSTYRSSVYADGISGGVRTVAVEDVVAFCEAAIVHLDATIDQNLRSDGLVHSYNLLSLSGDGRTASVAHLALMLEGQVAILGSNLLDGERAADLVEALFESELYRPDQQSFMLAPAHRPPSFLEKNALSPEEVERIPLLAALTSAGDRSVIAPDASGTFRFDADLTDETAVHRALDVLAESATWASLVDRHRDETCALYERTFVHRAFLGRSVAMHAYEGIGSIYWHMVSKLLLAIHDAASAAADADAGDAATERLVAAYERVRSGLGFNKTAAQFGAVPTDPYSHTPAHAGAQQPGMTGAVKEEILTRPRELGVRIERGELVFDRLLLRRAELLDAPRRWELRRPDGSTQLLDLPELSVGFTICQVPIVVAVGSEAAHIDVEFDDGRTRRHEGVRLGRSLSSMIFGRTGNVRAVRAWLPAS